MTSALSPSDADVRAVEGLISRLMARFPDVPADSVRQMVNTTRDQFTGTPIRDFIPVLCRKSRSGATKFCPDNAAPATSGGSSYAGHRASPTVLTGSKRPHRAVT